MEGAPEATKTLAWTGVSCPPSVPAEVGPVTTGSSGLRHGPFPLHPDKRGWGGMRSGPLRSSKGSPFTLIGPVGCITLYLQLNFYFLTFQPSKIVAPCEVDAKLITKQQLCLSQWSPSQRWCPQLLQRTPVPPGAARHGLWAQQDHTSFLIQLFVFLFCFCMFGFFFYLSKFSPRLADRI